MTDPIKLPPFVFRRYVDGVECAEGVTVERAQTLDDAIQIAARICPKRLLTVLIAVEQATADLREQVASINAVVEENDRLLSEVETLTDSNAAKADRLDRLGEQIVKLRAERNEARAKLALATRRFAEAINSPTYMGEPVLQNSGDRDAYEGCREDLLDWKRRAQKAEAELARLTTLRPASDHDGETPALWYVHAYGTWQSVGSSPYAVGTHWTPLPPVKEADHD